MYLTSSCHNSSSPVFPASISQQITDPCQQNPPSPPLTLSPEQLDFLKAWRPLSVRHLATDPGLVGNIWVRTYYSSETDAKHTAMISEINVDFAVDREERILDDASLYGGFGTDWERLFELLPELLETEWEGCPEWPGYKGRITRAVEMLKDARARFQGGGEIVEREGIDFVGRLIEGWRAISPEEEMQRRVLEALLSGVHKACVVNYLIIEDRHTLEGEEELLLMAFVDAWGRVVRIKRVNSEEAEMMGGMWLEQAFDDLSEWDEAEIGSDYEVEGAWEELMKHEVRS